MDQVRLLTGKFNSSAKGLFALLLMNYFKDEQPVSHGCRNCFGTEGRRQDYSETPNEDH